MFHSTMQDALDRGEPVSEPLSMGELSVVEQDDTCTAALTTHPGGFDLDNAAQFRYSTWVLENAVEIARDHDIHAMKPAVVSSDQTAAHDDLLFLVDEDDPTRAVVCAPRVYPNERDGL